MSPAARQYGVAILEQELHQLRLPDISGDFRVRRVGKVHYELSSLSLRSFHLPSSQISPIPNVGLQVSISDASAVVEGNWRVKLHFIRDHGTFDLKVEDLSISIGLKLGNDSSGKPTADVSSCSTHISSVRVHFSGRFSWLYNLFHSAIDSVFRRTLERQVCERVVSSVRDELQSYLRTLPALSTASAALCHLAVPEQLLGSPHSAEKQSEEGNAIIFIVLLAKRLRGQARVTGAVGKPVCPAALTALARGGARGLPGPSAAVPTLQGEFFSLARHSAVPFSPPPLALPPDRARMVYFGASSYFFNTAGLVYHTAGALVFELTDSMIPKGLEFHLNTSTFSAFVPQLEKMYPDMLMKLRLSTPAAPFLSIGPEGLSLQPVVDIQAYAILPSSSLAPLFLLNLTTNVSASVDVKSNRIVGSLAVGRVAVASSADTLSLPQVRTLQSVMNILTSSILLPRFNARLAQGFPLPLLDRIQLSNVLVQWHQNLLLLGADVHLQRRA
ncbi:PREDICTED: bactericidal permeability-increasing protein-like [Tinamus guttatus]|uniref:bactericidal permeability-increasing protein-like n=1 Tax=Tinamus guttatus TaxID=94827 RepID=UPI00052ED757|nr:PREDICTED: bactericidal permeability-increasing protein-like [Tinamus guttatus]